MKIHTFDTVEEGQLALAQAGLLGHTGYSFPLKPPQGYPTAGTTGIPAPVAYLNGDGTLELIDTDSPPVREYQDKIRKILGVGAPLQLPSESPEE